MHAVRLGLQGIEFLTTGRISLPIPETTLARLRKTAAVPDQPDRGWVDDWLHRSHLNFWASRR
jgi:uncharacterized protein